MAVYTKALSFAASATLTTHLLVDLDDLKGYMEAGSFDIKTHGANANTTLTLKVRSKRSDEVFTVASVSATNIDEAAIVMSNAKLPGANAGLSRLELEITDSDSTQDIQVYIKATDKVE